MAELSSEGNKKYVLGKVYKQNGKSFIYKGRTSEGVAKFEGVKTPDFHQGKTKKRTEGAGVFGVKTTKDR